MNRRIDIDAYLRNGYAIVRGLFSPDEAEAIRQQAIEVAERAAETGDTEVAEAGGQTRVSLNADMLTYEALRGVLLDERVVDVARQVLGDTPCYWGESSVNVGALRGGARGWHTDADTTPLPRRGRASRSCGWASTSRTRGTTVTDSPS